MDRRCLQEVFDNFHIYYKVGWVTSYRQLDVIIISTKMFTLYQTDACKKKIFFRTLFLISQTQKVLLKGWMLEGGDKIPDLFLHLSFIENMFSFDLLICHFYNYYL